jgi:hypothetical protein
LRNRAGTRSLPEQGRQAELERFTPHAEELPSGPNQLFAKRSTGDIVRPDQYFLRAEKSWGKKSKLASSSNGMRFAHLRIHGCGYGTWLEAESAAGPLAVGLRPRRAQHDRQAGAWATCAIKIRNC